MTLQDDLHSMLSTSSVRIPVRKLASVSGKVVSHTNCVGNVSRLMTKNVFFHAASLFVRYCLSEALGGFNVYAVGSDDCQVKQLK